MGLSVLALVQQFADKQGLPYPNALAISTDKSIRQYRALMTETVSDLSEYRWPQQTIYTTFVTVAGNDQGALSTLFGAGFHGIVQNTLWNQTRHLRWFGPLSEAQWVALQTLPNAGPEFQYWISRGRLWVTPAAVVGETVGAAYITKFNVLALDGVTYKQYITADTDTLLFPDNVILQFFEAKWKRQKGEVGWQDMWNDAMNLIAKNIVKDGAATLNLDSRPNAGLRPGIVIPAGSWPV